MKKSISAAGALVCLIAVGAMSAESEKRPDSSVNRLEVKNTPRRGLPTRLSNSAADLSAPISRVNEALRAEFDRCVGEYAKLLFHGKVVESGVATGQYRTSESVVLNAMTQNAFKNPYVVRKCWDKVADLDPMPLVQETDIHEIVVDTDDTGNFDTGFISEDSGWY